MPKKLETLHGIDGRYSFFCPGCKTYHFANTNPKYGGAWTFNGNEEKPTFRPSFLVGARGEVPRCHSFITDGNIQFLSDCDHELKGKTVELPDYYE